MIRVLTVIGCVILLASCSNDFELTSDWKDIPIVFGLIDPTEATHYIRIEKAFLDPDVPPSELATRADSLYYDNISVEISNVSDANQSWFLNEIDGNSIGLNKEEGIFANDPNILYTFTSGVGVLREGEKYRLTINRGDSKQPVTGETTIVGDFRVTTPSEPDELDWIYGNPPDFNGRNRDRNVVWRQPVGAAFYDVNVLFHFVEVDKNDPDIRDTLDITWVADRRILKESSSSRESTTILALDFYQFIAGTFEPNDNIRRILNSYDIEVIAAGEELEEYTGVALANAGITGSQVLPTTTNMSEGRGVFSSTNRAIIEGLTLTPRSLDSLSEGIYTKGLGF